MASSAVRMTSGKCWQSCAPLSLLLSLGCSLQHGQSTVRYFISWKEDQNHYDNIYLLITNKFLWRFCYNSIFYDHILYLFAVASIKKIPQTGAVPEAKILRLGYQQDMVSPEIHVFGLQMAAFSLGPHIPMNFSLCMGIPNIFLYFSVFSFYKDTSQVDCIRVYVYNLFNLILLKALCPITVTFWGRGLGLLHMNFGDHSSAYNTYW